jgi:predicted phosphodiesterase
VVRLGQLTAVGFAFLLVAGAAAGAFAALRAVSPSVERYALGTVAVRVTPARAGEIDAYAPLVDWGVRVRPHRSPLRVRLEFRALDRRATLASLRSGEAAERNVRALRRDLDGVVRGELRRAAVVGGLGALGGGILAGALAGAITRRRRWLAHGAFAGAVFALGAISLAAVDFAHSDARAFREPTFYARGDELPELLTFSEQLLTAGERYTDSYDAALRSLSNVIAVGSGRSSPRPTTSSAIVASDLHSNRLVLPALARFARTKTLFFVGDFTELGARIERGITGEIAEAGARVVAVSGNHDSASFMRALAAEGVTVLTRDGLLQPDGEAAGSPVVEVDGLSVAGWDDSLESKGSLAHHQLTIEGAALISQGKRLTEWFDSLTSRPDVVLVHRHGLAHTLLAHVASDPDAPPLLVLTGHDHEQHYEQEGPHVLVDGGTVGAGGPFAIGVAPAGFAQLHLGLDGRLEALDLIEIEPLYGQASARRVAFDAVPTIPLVPGNADGG